MEPEFKASVISENLDLQRARLFSLIEIGKNILAQNSPLSLTLICFLALHFPKQTWLQKELTVKRQVMV